MTKIIETIINSCTECPHYNVLDDSCALLDSEIEDVCSVPEDCPLDDYI